jgi:thioredoxin 1
MQTATSQELKTKIDNGESFVIDFFATWCGPCKVLTRNFQVLEEKGRSFPVFAFDVDSDMEFTKLMEIRSVPTVKYFKGGQVVETKTGVQTPDQLAESIRTNLSLV